MYLWGVLKPIVQFNQMGDLPKPCISYTDKAGMSILNCFYSHGSSCKGCTKRCRIVNIEGYLISEGNVNCGNYKPVNKKRR